jgi:nucleoside-diphosphate-sugar epimerase
VRGTVRDVKKVEGYQHLVDIAKQVDGEFSVVNANLLDDDEKMWDGVVEGCEFVIHTASPAPAAIPDDPDDLIKPAVNGTRSVLMACARTKGKVKHVVVTSSVAAIENGAFVEANTIAVPFPIDESYKTPADGSQPAYQTSKIRAEEAAWEISRKLKEDGDPGAFDVTTINPCYVLGPLLSSKYAGSHEVVKRLMLKTDPLLPQLAFQVVDVRDVAFMHVRALSNEACKNQRYIAWGETVWYMDMANALNENMGNDYSFASSTAPKFVLWMLQWCDEPLKMIMPRIGKWFTFTNDKAKKDFGMEFRDAREATVSMGYTMIHHGCVPNKLSGDIPEQYQ